MVSEIVEIDGGQRSSDMAVVKNIGGTTEMPVKENGEGIIASLRNFAF